jgi:ribosomal-protein-alanine N-acetyltransferase
VIIREASAADLEAIAQIQAASPEASQWKPADYLRYQCALAWIESAAVGFVAWRTVAEEEHEILNVAIVPGLRRRGVGRRLVQEALNSSPGRWFLEVRESNVAARALYGNIGFTQVGVRDKYYENPLESGIVMSFCSCYRHSVGGHVRPPAR